jgi:hypothetical protein
VALFDLATGFVGAGPVRLFARNTATRGRVLFNIGDSQRARQSSNFGTHVELERGVSSGRSTSGGQTNSTTSQSNTEETVTVFRVEGKGNQRVVIDDAGRIDIPEDRTKKGRGREKTLFLNFGDENRADVFLNQRLPLFPDTIIKTFRVPKSFVDGVRDVAVPQVDKKLFPNRPEIADPTKANNQFGLTEEQIQTLRQVIIQGSGNQE